MESHSRTRYWKFLAHLAWKGPVASSVLQSLAFQWNQNCSSRILTTLCLPWRRLAASLVGIGGRKSVSTVHESCSRDHRILLVPACDRPHFVEPICRLGRALEDQNPGCTMMLEPPGSTQFAKRVEAMGYSGPVTEFCYEPPVLGWPHLIMATVLWRGILRMTHHTELGSLLRKQGRRRFLEIWSACALIEGFRRELRRMGVTTVVTMSDFIAPASQVVAAANSLGLETHQVLHGGIAAPMYTPFQTRWLWTDLRVTRESLLKFGAPPERVRVLPGVQLGLGGAGFRPSCKQKHVERRFRVLLLAQFHGHTLEGIQIMGDVVRFCLDSVSARPGQWEMMIRPHPSDSADDVREMHRLVAESGTRTVITDPRLSLAAEVSDADLVVSAASTGILTAILSGTPALLVWSSDLDVLHGAPLLPEEWVARDREQVGRLLDLIAAHAVAGSLSQLAALQAAALGLENVPSGVGEFARALLRRDVIAAQAESVG